MADPRARAHPLARREGRCQTPGESHWLNSSRCSTHWPSTLIDGSADSCQREGSGQSPEVKLEVLPEVEGSGRTRGRERRRKPQVAVARSATPKDRKGRFPDASNLLRIYSCFIRWSESIPPVPPPTPSGRGQGSPRWSCVRGPPPWAGQWAGRGAPAMASRPPRPHEAVDSG